MSEIASLIRQFPEGSFFIMLAILGAITKVVHSIANRNRPACDCDCCSDADEDVDEEEEED